MKNPKRIILAITGASGAVYGLRALDILKALGYEVHLIVSPMGARIIEQESEFKAQQVYDKADFLHQAGNLNASIASGSFHTLGMLVIPCSIKTLSGIANSYAENLIQRAGDVCLKEGRPLLLAVRETPLHSIHLKLMLRVSQSGAIIFPPVPTFYDRPQTIDDIINASVGRMLARIGIHNDLYEAWEED